MDAIWKRLVPLAGILSLAGCAAQRYQAVPIVASATASRFESRNLADAGLQLFVEQNLGHALSPWPPATWDLQTLSLAGLYFNPALDSARARVAGSEAALITAGGRPHPPPRHAPGIRDPLFLTSGFANSIENS